MNERFIQYTTLTGSGKSKQKKLEIPREFKIEKFGSRYLTHLDRSKVSRWSDSSRILRSLLFDRDNQVRSIGLPKFFDHTKDFVYADQANQEGFRAWVKYDGSLVIRYVDRGEVILRTRNSLASSELIYEARLFAEKNYPELLDPSWGENLSLHFEYLNPRRQLIIPIEQEDFVLIGGANHQTLKLLTPDQACAAAVQLEQFFAAEEIEGCQSIEELESRISSREIEGAVLRFDGQQKMLRVKTDFYRNQKQIKIAASKA
jgi:hypothetical protein